MGEQRACLYIHLMFGYNTTIRPAGCEISVNNWYAILLAINQLVSAPG